MNWHLIPMEEAIAHHHSSANGISADDAEQRLAQYGRNQLQEKRARTPLVMFAAQFGDFMILVLIAAAVIAGISVMWRTCCRSLPLSFSMP